MIEEQRRVGRPPMQKPEVKKGKPSWKPASVTDVVNKEPGYRYRWSNKNADNIAKKEAEGWETVSKLTADQVREAAEGRAKNITSTHEKHDVILQRMPEEVAEARDEYMAEKTRKRTVGLTAHLKKDMRENAGNAPVHGKITISSLKGGEQVIE